MILKPRTAADASVIRGALSQVKIAKAAALDVDFRSYLTERGLRLLMEREACSFPSFEDFQAWLSSGDRNAEAIRFLVETYNLNAEARSVFQALKLDYSDPAFAAFQRQAATPPTGGAIRWEALSVLLRGHLLKSDSFAAFFAWLGSSDHGAEQVRGWVDRGGYRREVSSLVAKWRNWYANDQARFDLDRRTTGPVFLQ